MNPFTEKALHHAQDLTALLTGQLHMLEQCGRTERNTALIQSAQRARHHLDHLMCELNAHNYLQEDSPA